MAHGKHHRKDCKCGFCRLSASYAGNGRRKHGRRRKSSRKAR